MKNRNRLKYLKRFRVPGLISDFGIDKADGFFAKKGFTTWWNGCGIGPQPTRRKAEAHVADYIREKLCLELGRAEERAANCRKSLQRLEAKGVDAFLVKGGSDEE